MSRDRDYTMDDFHAEMRRREAAKTKPRRRDTAASPRPTSNEPVHGNMPHLLLRVGPHAPLIDLDQSRIVGCSCGWRTAPGTNDSDDAFAEHAAIAGINSSKDLR